MNTIILYSGVVVVNTIIAVIAEKSKYGSKLCLLLIIMLFSLLAGFRSYNVGADTESYINVITTIDDSHPTFEWGFLFLIKSIGYVSLDYTVVFVILAIITNSLIILRYWQLRRTMGFYWSIFSYSFMFYFMTMSGIRQCLAAAIVFYFSKFVIEEWNLILFLFGIILAFFLHTSSIIGVLFLLPKLTKKINLRKMKIYEIAITFFLPIMAIGLLYVAFSRYSHYLDQIESVDLGGMMFLRLGVLILVLLHFYIVKSVTSNNECAKDILRATLCSEIMVVIAIGLSYLAPNIWRVGWYFWLYSPCLYSYFLSKKASKCRVNSLIIAGALTVVMISIYGVLSGNGNKLVPYEFFWEV